MGILEGKVAIVTGGGQGVGRGVALALAKEGASVVIPDIDFAAATSTADEIKAFGGKALPVACDVSTREACDAAVAATIREFGTVNILVNNAQAARPGVPIEEETDEGWFMTFRSGVDATFYFMQACFPYMKEKGGKIINFGSTAGINGLKGMASYAATKEAIRGLSRVAANEWGKYNINVNVILPWANAPSWQRVERDFPKMAAAGVAANPMRRVGDCERDVGRAAVFLAGPDSDYVNGLNMTVDGGMAMLR